LRWLENSARFLECPALTAWETGAKLVRASPADADMLTVEPPLVLPWQFWAADHWTFLERPPHAVIRGRSPARRILIDLVEEIGAGDLAGKDERPPERYSGLPGHPSARRLFLAEHQRRHEKGLTFFTHEDEARAVYEAVEKAYPQIALGKLGSLKNIIRKRHNEFRETMKNLKNSKL
jgi:hypothetical protein